MLHIWELLNISCSRFRMFFHKVPHYLQSLNILPKEWIVMTIICSARNHLLSFITSCPDLTRPIVNTIHCSWVNWTFIVAVHAWLDLKLYAKLHWYKLAWQRSVKFKFYFLCMLKYANCSISMTSPVLWSIFTRELRGAQICAFS